MDSLVWRLVIQLLKLFQNRLYTILLCFHPDLSWCTPVSIPFFCLANIFQYRLYENLFMFLFGLNETYFEKTRNVRNIRRCQGVGSICMLLESIFQRGSMEIRFCSFANISGKCWTSRCYYNALFMQIVIAYRSL